jgi:hypothetical protein
MSRYALDDPDDDLDEDDDDDFDEDGDDEDEDEDEWRGGRDLAGSTDLPSSGSGRPLLTSRYELPRLAAISSSAKLEQTRPAPASRRLATLRAPVTG